MHQSPTALSMNDFGQKYLIKKLIITILKYHEEEKADNLD